MLIKDMFINLHSHYLFGDFLHIALLQLNPPTLIFEEEKKKGVGSEAFFPIF